MGIAIRISSELRAVDIAGTHPQLGTVVVQAARVQKRIQCRCHIFGAASYHDWKKAKLMEGQGLTGLLLLSGLSAVKQSLLLWSELSVVDVSEEMYSTCSVSPIPS